jgi:hypothetical protein
LKEKNKAVLQYDEKDGTDSRLFSVYVKREKGGNNMLIAYIKL